MAAHKRYTYCPICGTKLHTIQRTGALRPVCPNCDYTVFYDPKVAVVMLITHKDTVLLVKRGVDPERGKWALPAGFVNAGEDPAAAAAREVTEETGLAVLSVQLLDVFGNPGDSTADILIAYAVAVNNNAPVAGDDADEAAFFTLDALPPTAFHTTSRLIHRWQQGQTP